MKTIFKVFVVLLVLVNSAAAQVKWAADPAHTNARFEVQHLGISFVDGAFTKLEGSLESATASDFNQAKVDFTIDVNSINTRVEMRDNHLKGDDFFSAAKFPNMTFKNAVLKKGKKDAYTLTGDLTIRDVTKSVTFAVVQHNGVITDPWGGTRIGFTATATINRFDFNINYADKTAVAPEIKITINTELVKK